MTSICNPLNRLETPASPLPMVAFRLTITGLLLVQAFFLLPDFKQLFTGSGVYRQELIDHLTEPVPRAEHIRPVLVSVGLTNVSPSCLAFGVYLVSLVALLVGWKTRWMAGFALASKLLWSEDSPGVLYGADQFGTICLFLCWVFPVGQMWSVDGQIRPATVWRSVQARRFLFTLRGILCICYCASGFEKGAGFDWWNGNSIFRALHFAGSSEPLIDAILTVPAFAVIAGIGTVVLEAAYPLLSCCARTRLPCVLGIITMHVGIAVFLELYFFGAIMVAMNVCAWLVPDSGRD